MKNCHLLKVCSWKKCTKQSKFKFFSGSSLALSALQVPGSRPGGCRKQNPLLGIYVGRVMLLWRKFNELSENVSLDSKFILVFEMRQFQVMDFFFFFRCQFFRTLQGWMGYVKALLLSKCEKLELVESFSSRLKKLHKKSKFNFFFLLIINLLSLGIHCYPFTLASPCCELSENLILTLNLP